MSLYTSTAQERRDNGLCPKCGNSPDVGYITCRICIEATSDRAKARFKRIRAAVLEHYGGYCVCCGEDEPEFLAIDHMPGHDNRVGDQRNLTNWVFKHKCPEGFRILCHNCNMAIRWGRICPHQKWLQLENTTCTLSHAA